MSHHTATCYGNKIQIHNNIHQYTWHKHPTQYETTHHTILQSTTAIYNIHTHVTTHCATTQHTTAFHNITQRTPTYNTTAYYITQQITPTSYITHQRNVVRRTPTHTHTTAQHNTTSSHVYRHTAHNSTSHNGVVTQRRSIPWNNMPHYSTPCITTTQHNVASYITPSHTIP